MAERESTKTTVNRFLPWLWLPVVAALVVFAGVRNGWTGEELTNSVSGTNFFLITNSIPKPSLLISNITPPLRPRFPDGSRFVVGLDWTLTNIEIYVESQPVVTRTGDVWFIRFPYATNSVSK